MVKSFSDSNKNNAKTKNIRVFVPIKWMTILIFCAAVIILMFALFAINNKATNELRSNLTSYLISNLAPYKEAIQTNNFTELFKDLNRAMGDTHMVKYIVITDLNHKEIFSTFPTKNAYKI